MKKLWNALFIVALMLFVLNIESVCHAGNVRVTDEGMKYFNAGNFRQALSCFRKGAEAKDADAMFFLGHMYHKGLGVQKNDKEAMKWFKFAAENGSMEATSNVGRMYSNGEGVNKAYKEAAKWFINAAKQGNDIAMYQLGKICLYGYGISKNYNEALYWFKQSAAKGNVSAMHMLGLLCFIDEVNEEMRSGKRSDLKNSTYWYMKAAEKGDIDAMKQIGHRYRSGQGLQRNEKIANVWFQKANALEAKKDAEEMQMLKKSATQGSVESLYQLGRHYDHGEGVAQNKSEAENYYRQAIAKGHTGAMVSLGLMKPHIPETKELYTQAANAGDTEGMLQLGLLYLNGDGVQKDVNTAIKWLTKSAENGNEVGMFFLASTYEYNVKDMNKATYWYQKAAELGLSDARARLRQMQ